MLKLRITGLICEAILYPRDVGCNRKEAVSVIITIRR
jgi:hypothetical protein